MGNQIVKISEVKANPNNPRLIKDDKFKKLVQSIIDFPEMLEIRPIVVNTDMVVLGGNMRLKACKEAGLKEIPIIIADNLTEEQQREFIIKDNVAGGEWDWELLANEWDADNLAEWGLDLPDYDTEQLEASEDDFEPIIPEEPITILGDLYEIGEHRLLCGDSTDSDQVAKLMNGELADMVLTDPPYNVNYQGGNRTEMKALHRRTDGLKIENDKMSDSEFYNFLYNSFFTLNSYCKKGGIWYVWHADMESVNFRTAMQNSGVLLKQNLIWEKDCMVMGRQDYQWQHEPCLYGWKEGASHNWYSDRKQTTILKFSRPKVSKKHPTMKPILLICYQIENSTKKGQLVIDGFLGSGSTIVASHQLKRKCYGMELDPKYCDVIVKRMLKLDPNIEIKKNGVLIDKQQWKQ